MCHPAPYPAWRGSNMLDAVTTETTGRELEFAIGPCRRTPPLRGGTRVEQPLSPFAESILGQMAVPVDHDRRVWESTIHARGAAHTSTTVVHHRDTDAVEVELQGLGQDPDETSVVVPKHCMHRGVLLELIDEVGGHDVSGVEDDVSATERRVQLGWQSTRRSAHSPTGGR
jgi:hypothetical protein